MMSKALALALALTSAVSAGPLRRQDPCNDTYDSCVASGTPEVACSCDLARCSGEDSGRIMDFCATATASIVRSTASTPAPTLISRGYPLYFTNSTVSTPVPTSIPGGCNPAHPGSCPSSYFLTVTAPTPVATQVATPVATPATVPAASGSSPVKTDKTWALNNLTRYCGEDGTGCDYNFVIEADGKTERCTVVRMPGKDAASESWSNQPCTAGSPFAVSWGYVAEPAPAYSVITVVNGKELAWFGASDINGQEVTPSNPFGSGSWPDSTSPVYTY